MRRGVRARLERVEILKEWREWIPLIVRSVKETLGEDAEVFIFGSVVEGRLTAASDVDVLVASNNVPDDFLEAEELKSRIERLAGLPPRHPFELHLVTRRQASHYLKRLRVSYVRVG